MTLEILCTPLLSKDEVAFIEKFAKANKMTRSEVVIMAVKFFSKKCVRTQKISRLKNMK